MIKAENNRKSTHTRHAQKAFWWIGLESGNANKTNPRKGLLKVRLRITGPKPKTKPKKPNG